MKLIFAPLFSGSSGNSTYISAGGTSVLVDAGVSCLKITNEMKKFGAAPDGLQGLLITHEHSDHVHGAGILARKFGIPIYATEGTWEAAKGKLGEIAPQNMRIIEAGHPFTIGELDIYPFTIPHDAADPVGYAVSHHGIKVCIATDMGHMSKACFEAVHGSDLLLLESNYDVDMLEAGRYPFDLKKRILGRKGHLSNDDAADAVVRLYADGVKNIILGHLSKENNFPDLAWETTAEMLRSAGIAPGSDMSLALAGRDGLSGVFELSKEA